MSASSKESKTLTGSGPVMKSTSLKIVSGAAAAVPLWLLRAAAATGGVIHYLTAPEKRRYYKQNLSAVPGADLDRLCIRAFQNHALNILEIMSASAGGYRRFRRNIIIRGAKHLDKILEGGRGAVVVTGHFGNWELAGIALSECGYAITTIAGEQLRRGWSEDIKNFKRAYGIKVISIKKGLRSLYRDLERNRLLVLHLDGNMFSRGDKTSFLGKTASFPRGPARIARVMKSPIIFADCLRHGGNDLQISLSSPIEAPRNTADETGTMRWLVKYLEERIIKNPDQWCIFRRMHDDRY